MDSSATGRVAAALVVVAAAGSALFDARADLFPLDLALLGEAADTLLSTRWASAFESTEVQVGPLQLVLVGLSRALARAGDLSYRSVFSVAFQTGIVAGLMITVRTILYRSSAFYAAAAGLAGVVGGLCWTAYISGHPEEPAIALLWIAAAVAATRGSGPAAGLALGLAATLKLSGLLGLPLLLIAPGWRVRSTALVICTAGVAVGYGPFFLFGDVQTFAHAWPVDSGLWRALLAEGSTFPWSLRLLQGGMVGAVGAVAALWLRRTPSCVWTLPLVIVAFRIVTDPQPHHYFWSGFDVAAIVGAASLSVEGFSRGALAAACATAGMVSRYLPPGPGQATRVSVGALLIALSRPVLRNTPDLDPAPSGRSGAGGEEPVGRSGRAV